MVMFSDMTRGRGYNLKHRRFQWKNKKHVLPFSPFRKVTEHGNKLPREVVESTSVEKFKSCLFRAAGSR